MSSGITHSKWSKHLFGKNYSYVHSWMDKPSQGVLKWNHRLINHNWLLTPLIAVFKWKKITPGLVVIQHLFQDYQKKALYLLVGFLFLKNTFLIKPYLIIVLFFLVLDFFLKLFFDIVYRL